MAESTPSRNGLYKARTVFAVELHPSTVANVEEGVKEQINTHVLRYVDELKGVLLSYSNIEILTRKPIIHPYFPYFHVDVRANVLVFKPTPGMTLVGRVNHMGEDYISALVLGVFNVTIPARSVMAELRFLREENKWIHLLQPEHQIGEHSYIVFKVQEVRDHGGFFHLTGTMMDTNTGAADFLFPDLQLLEPPVPAGAEDVQMEPASDGDAVGMQAGGEMPTTNGAVPVREEKRQDTHKHKDKRKRDSGAATDDRRGKRQKDGGESFGAAPTPKAAAAAGDEPDCLATGAAGQATEDKLKCKEKHKHKDRSGKEEKDDSDNDNKDKSKKKDKEHKDKHKDKAKGKDKDRSGREDKKRKDGDKHADGKGSGVAAAPAVDSAPSPPATAAGGAKQVVDARPSGARPSRPKVEGSGGAEVGDQRADDGAGAEVGKRPEGGGSEKKKHKDKDRKKEGKELSQEGKESSKKSKKKDTEKQRG